MSEKTVATNRKANFEYFILERYEAGIALQGSEIKAARAGQMSLSEAFVRVEPDGAWLIDAYIAPYDPASRFNHDPRRPRRLLLHKKEILELWGKVRQKGMTVIPTRAYLKNGRLKVEIALARGKRAHDKRQAIAERDRQREEEREFRIR